VLGFGKPKNVPVGDTSKMARAGAALCAGGLLAANIGYHLLTGRADQLADALDAMTVHRDALIGQADAAGQDPAPLTVVPAPRADSGDGS
jgi:hypothetical protein